MPRKQRVAVEAPIAESTDISVTTTEPPVQHTKQDDLPNAPLQDAEGADELADSKWKRNANRINVTPAGVYYGDDFRYKQVYIKFDDDHKPTEEQKQKMRDAGFRYRMCEKRWDARESASTRLAGKHLVAEFTGITLGAGKGH